MVTKYGHNTVDELKIKKVLGLGLGLGLGCATGSGCAPITTYHLGRTTTYHLLLTSYH